VSGAGSTGGAERGRALVTGASSGIGAAFAEALARRGLDLVLVARRRERLERSARELRGLGVAVEVLAADLTRPDELARVERRLASDERLELLVNDAGVMTHGAFAELDVEREAEMVHLNATVPLRLCHAALGPMLARGRGAIVNVASRAALRPWPPIATYSATKAFLLSLTGSLAEQVRARGVRLQALCPGATRTELFELAGLDLADLDDVSEPGAVVAASLAALDRGEEVCIPGERPRERWLRRWLPRRAVAKLAGVFRRLAGV